MARSRRLAAALVVLTSFGCSTVPVHVTLPQLAIGEPAFAATVVAYTSAPVLGGNRLDILLNGDEVFQAKIAAIRAARKNINYAQYVFVVVDGVWSTIGSTNLDRRSFALNEELNLVVYDREFARRLEEIFERDLGESRPVTYPAWRNRGIMSRMLELLSLPIRDQL